MGPVAFIPAKGHSERLPGKNVAFLGGRPLLHWTLAAACESELFEQMYVSTDSDRVAEAAAAFPAVRILMRPIRLQDSTVEMVLLWHRLHRAWPHEATVYVLLPTSPFRTAETMRAAWQLFQSHPRYHRLLSVTAYAHPPQWALHVVDADGEERLGVWMPHQFNQTRSQLPQLLRHDGGHQIIRQLDGPEWLPFFPPADEVLDINTPDDLAYAQWRLDQRSAMPSKDRSSQATSTETV